MGPLSKKRKFVRDGVFYAELFEFLRRELSEDGFSGVEHRVTPTRTEIIIKATKTKEVLGDKGRRIRELTSLVQQRWRYAEGGVQLFVERVAVRGLSAMAQAESLRFKLLSGLPIRRAAMGIMRYIMESGAKGVDVLVSGKIRGQRGKCMKFRDGYMLKSGDAKTHHTDQATRHVCLRAGTIGIKLKIMLPYDAEGIAGTSKMHPDVITVLPPKETTA
jgi:small subunit ribosomal protein S3e